VKHGLLLYSQTRLYRIDVEDKELGFEMDPLLTGVSLLRSFKRLIVGKPLACLV